MNRYSLISYIPFWWSAKTLYDIHSPTLYEFFKFTLDQKRLYYDFELLDRVRYQMKKNQQELKVSTYGAGSKVFDVSASIHHLVSRTLSPKEVSRQLYRMNIFFQSEHCLELGTCLGLNSMAMAQSCVGKLTTIEAHSDYYAFAKQLFETYRIENIDLHRGLFTEIMPELPQEHYDLIFIDGDHTYLSTLELIDFCKPLLSSQGVIVLSDIHWSAGMYRAWKEILHDPDFSISIDLFHAGILWHKGWKIEKKHINYITEHWTKPWKYIHGI